MRTSEGVYLAYMGRRNPWTDGVQILFGYRDPRVITYIKFGDDRLRGFWWAGCQSLPFPIDIDRRPYNSATLPRALWSVFEIVMSRPKYSTTRFSALLCEICQFRKLKCNISEGIVSVYSEAFEAWLDH